MVFHCLYGSYDGDYFRAHQDAEIRRFRFPVAAAGPGCFLVRLFFPGMAQWTYQCFDGVSVLLQTDAPVEAIICVPRFHTRQMNYGEFEYLG